MSSLRRIQLLDEVARIAGEGGEFDAGLRACGLPGAEDLADRLSSGQDLTSAMTDLVGPRVAQVFATEGTGLQPAALLASQELRLARERRQLLLDRLAYPAMCMVTLLGVLVWLHLHRDLPLGSGWLWVTWSTLGLCVAILMPLPAALRLGPLNAWRRHAKLAGRYRRAAVVARWHLNEAACGALFGSEMGAVMPYLGRRRAEETCRRLGEHHGQAALRGARRAGVVATVLLFVAAGGVALAAASNLWSDLRLDIERSFEDIDDGELTPR